MQDTRTPPAGSPFGLSGEQYWVKPMDQRSVIAYATDLSYKDKEGQGIHVDVPPKVYTDRHKDVPLIAFNSNSFADLHHYPLRRTAQIVLVHLETGKAGIAKAADTPASDPNAPAWESQPGWSVEDLIADAAEPGLGPRLGHYAVCMLNGPDASETRRFAVYPSEAAEIKPETAKALERLRGEGGPPLPALKPGQLGLVHQQPKVVTENHWKIAIVPGKDGKWLHLSYRLQGLPRFLFPKDHPHSDETGKRVYGVLPVLLAGFDGNRALVLNRQIGIPVITQPAGDKDHPVLGGYVSMPLDSLVDGKTGPLTLYAFALDQRAVAEAEIR